MATSYIIPSNLWRTQNKNYYCKNGFDSDNYRSDKSQQHTCHENYSRSAPNLPLLFSCVYDFNSSSLVTQPTTATKSVTKLGMEHLMRASLPRMTYSLATSVSYV